MQEIFFARKEATLAEKERAGARRVRSSINPVASKLIERPQQPLTSNGSNRSTDTKSPADVGWQQHVWHGIWDLEKLRRSCEFACCTVRSKSYGECWMLDSLGAAGDVLKEGHGTGQTVH